MEYTDKLIQEFIGKIDELKLQLAQLRAELRASTRLCVELDAEVTRLEQLIFACDMEGR